MALTDIFIRHVKHSGGAAGDKYGDGQGMFLLVKGSHKYWRLSYRFSGKQKMLALGVYPAISLAQARRRRDEARQMLAEGIDPGQAKAEAKLAQEAESANTFEALARQWLDKVSKSRTASTQDKITAFKCSALVIMDKAMENQRLEIRIAAN